MTFLLAMLGGAVGAAAAYLIGAFATVAIATYLALPDREGALGFFAFFFVGPVAGIVGLVVGVWLVLRYWGGHRGAAPLAGRGLLVIGAIAALVAAGIWYRLETVGHFSGREPTAEFEIRWPADKPPPERRAVSVELHTDRNTTDALLADDWLRQEGNRAVVRGLVPLYFRTTQRILVLKVAGEPDRLFTLKLSARPRYSTEYGAWQKLDFVAAADEQPKRPGPGEDYELRLRVPDPDVPYVQPER
jgi:hypothetical protein